jgi:hypothetical protein
VFSFLPRRRAASALQLEPVLPAEAAVQLRDGDRLVVADAHVPGDARGEVSVCALDARWRPPDNFAET